MQILKNRSIKNKIVFMNMIITLIISIIAISIYAVSEIDYQKKLLINNAKLDTKIVIEAITASLDFNYRKDAESVLAKMSIRSYLKDCIVFNRQGDLFVSLSKKKYRQADYQFDVTRPYRFDDDRFYYHSDILDKKQTRIGSIVMVISTRAYQDRIATFIRKVLLLFLLIFILSFILSSFMQRFISKPILKLSNITRDIRNKHDLNIDVHYQSKDEIGQLFSNFNKMLRAIREKESEREMAEKEQERLQLQLQQAQKMEAIGQLAGGIAHDFNNILTAINGYADLALTKVESDTQLSKMLMVIRESGKRASDLTKQLLTFSRKQIVEVKTLDLNETINGMEGMLSRLIEEDMDLEMHFDQPCFIDTDKGQLEQIIMNLVVNARDAIRQNEGSNREKLIKVQTGTVTIETDGMKTVLDLKPGQYALISVSDTGIGMDKETKGKIFEPFFTTKPREKGTGLGLSTVYGIVKQHKGAIYVYSEVGKGTTFKIYWPHSESETVEAIPVPDQTPLKTGTESILLVEDDRDVLSFASNALTSLGYKVFEADCGESALKIAEKNSFNFDLIITDVIMPRMSGPEFAEIFRSHKPGIKILFASGYTFDLIVKNGVVNKDTNFISKPFSRKEIAIKIRSLFDD